MPSGYIIILLVLNKSVQFIWMIFEYLKFRDKSWDIVQLLLYITYLFIYLHLTVHKLDTAIHNKLVGS